MKLSPHDILVRPLLTEKITAMRESANKIAFVVKSNVNRIQVKRAVETTMKVRVERVNLVNVPGKTKRLGRFAGKRSDWKKAIVTLKEGEKVDLYESV